MQQQLIQQETKAKVKRFDYPEDFDWVWNNWQSQKPRARADPKKRAFKAFSARQKEGYTLKEMVEGLCRYGRYCNATGKFRTEFVMQLATFFGPDCHFENEWAVTSEQVEATMVKKFKSINSNGPIDKPKTTRDRTIEEDLTDRSWAYK